MDKNEKKNIQVKFVCSSDELAQIDYSARKAGMSRAGYMRELLYHGSIEYHVNFTKEDARGLLSVLCDISNSMSKISYAAWLKCSVDEGEFLQLESNFKKLVESVGNLITG